MKNDKGRVLIAAPVNNVLIDGLTDAGYICALHVDITQAMAPLFIKDCVGVITSTRLQLDKELIDAAPSLQWIGRMGSGMEVIDTVYAAEKNIACYSSPEGNSNAVGEHAIGMLLSLLNRISVSNAEVKSGLWLREENRGTELYGKTIGIIGFGHTGRSFAQKLQGFDVRILAYDKYSDGEVPSYVTKCNDLSPIFDQADIISFHVPLQADTVHYFDTAFINGMQRPFILINTARGVVTDTAALSAGLKNGKITGACLDVFEQEPLSKMNNTMRAMFDDLVQLPQVLITPHIAGYTVEALYKMSKVLLDKITI